MMPKFKAFVEAPLMRIFTGLKLEDFVTDVTSINFVRNELTDGGGCVHPFGQVIEFMQYVGLKDKNGNEIYNHQKVLVDSPKGVFEAKVVFELGSFGIVATKGRVCDYLEASWIDDFVPFIDLYVIENCDDDTLWMVEVVK